MMFDTASTVTCAGCTADTTKLAVREECSSSSLSCQHRDDPNSRATYTTEAAYVAICVVLVLLTLNRRRLSSNHDYRVRRGRRIKGIISTTFYNIFEFFQRKMGFTSATNSTDHDSNQDSSCCDINDNNNSYGNICIRSRSNSNSKSKLFASAKSDHFFSTMSQDILLHITTFLEVKDILHLSGMNRALSRSLKSDFIWEQLWKLRYSSLWSHPFVVSLRTKRGIFWDPALNYGSPQQGWFVFYLEFEYSVMNWLLASACNMKLCLVGIYGSILEITDFVEQHPGSLETLLLAAGLDASENFKDIGHSVEAVSLANTMVKFSHPYYQRRMYRESIQDIIAQISSKLGSRNRIPSFEDDHDTEGKSKPLVSKNNFQRFLDLESEILLKFAIEENIESRVVRQRANRYVRTSVLAGGPVGDDDDVVGGHGGENAQSELNNNSDNGLLSSAFSIASSLISSSDYLLKDFNGNDDDDDDDDDDDVVDVGSDFDSDFKDKSVSADTILSSSGTQRSSHDSDSASSIVTLVRLIPSIAGGYSTCYSGADVVRPNKNANPDLNPIHDGDKEDGRFIHLDLSRYRRRRNAKSVSKSKTMTGHSTEIDNSSSKNSSSIYNSNMSSSGRPNYPYLGACVHTGQPRVFYDPLEHAWIVWWTCCGLGCSYMSTAGTCSSTQGLLALALQSRLSKILESVGSTIGEKIVGSDNLPSFEKICTQLKALASEE